MRREQVEVDGLTLSYLEAGSGPPVLLVHGWPTSSFLWRNVIPHLATHRRVLAIDLPGFGASSKPLDRDYTFAFFRSALDGFADAVGLGRFGAAVAVELEVLGHEVLAVNLDITDRDA